MEAIDPDESRDEMIVDRTVRPGLYQNSSGRRIISFQSLQEGHLKVILLNA